MKNSSAHLSPEQSQIIHDILNSGDTTQVTIRPRTTQIEVLKAEMRARGLKTIQQIIYGLLDAHTIEREAELVEADKKLRRSA